MSKKRPAIRIYTDGGCDPNPGPGGWGAVLLGPGRRRQELSGHEAETTNNRMEITAAIAALESLDTPHRVALYTDSQYLRKGITEWIDGWVRNGWQTAGKTPVKNRDLWERLHAALPRHEIHWHWVKGHAGNRWNERADRLAATASRRRHATKPPDRPAIHAYTAISCSGASGAGRWAVVLRYEAHEKMLEGDCAETTSNRMHLVSAIEALRAIRSRDIPVHLYTPSSYARDGATRWIAGWRARGWKTREGRDVQHRDLWEVLDAAIRDQPVEWHVVKEEEWPEAMARAKAASQGGSHDGASAG